MANEIKVSVNVIKDNGTVVVQTCAIKREPPYVQVGQVVNIIGKDGRGVVSILKTSTSGYTDTYTITYTDETTSTFNVVNGTNGEIGRGIVSILKTSTINLVDTYTITYTDATTSTFTVANGANGITPTIGANKHWYIGTTDTGILAEGQDGSTPVITIGENGNWFVDGVDSGKTSKGADGYTPVKGVDYNDGNDGYTPVKGVDYNDGNDGYTPVKGVDYTDGTTPTIGANKHWYIGTTDTGILAEGQDGSTPIITIGENGNWFVDGVDSGKTSKGADGYTPVKGVDYNDGNDGYTPVKGVDYNDGNDGYTPVKGVDYNDGADGSITDKHFNISASNWVSDTPTYTGFTYKCDIEITGVTASDVAMVVFSQEQASSGNYAQVCATGSGIVTIYSKVNSNITIPTVLIFKAN